MNRSHWIKKHTDSLVGKTVAISGGTGGIGKELCMLLVSLGAQLVLLDRDPEKSMALEENLRTHSPSLSIRRVPMDLTNMDSVIRAARELERLSIDALILNAGIYQVPRYQCDTGWDNVFQVNFAAPYYLVRTLRPHLQKREGRVIAVGSIAHNNSPTDPNDIDFRTRKKSSLVYGNSKRFLMYALYGLYDNGPGLAITHPGITLTGISAHHPPWLFRLIKLPMRILFMSPGDACLSILAGMFENCGRNEWIGPKWFDLWGSPAKRRLTTCSNEEADFIFRQAENVYTVLKDRADRLP